MRSELVDFFWEQRHWPYATRAEYVRMWDWRYESLGDERARVWIARVQATGEILGHLAVYPRRFRYRGRDVLVGVPGNFLVRAEHRNSLIGPRLAAGLRRLVADGEFDLILAYGNPAAHQMFSRLGFRELGRLHEFLDVRRSASILRRYTKAAILIAPVVDAVLAARRWWRTRARGHSVRNWQAREIGADELDRIDRGHWSEQHDQIIGAATSAYFANRFLQAPFSDYRIVGVFDQSSALQALLAVSLRRRVKVCECVTNVGAIDVPTAIEVAIRSIPDTHAVLVPALPDSRLANELRGSGYLGREPKDPVAARSLWSAYWRDDHLLAAELADATRWSLLFGSTHY
jgi:hypothetical protein